MHVYPWVGCGAFELCKLAGDNLYPKPRNLGVPLNGGYSIHVLVADAHGDLPMNLAATYACFGITAFEALKKNKVGPKGVIY